MGIYAKTIQAQLTAKEYEELVALAQARGVTIAELVRAVVVACLEMAAQEQRQSALERLLELDGPAPDWAQMEAEIEQGVLDTE